MKPVPLRERDWLIVKSVKSEILCKQRRGWTVEEEECLFEAGNYHKFPGNCHTLAGTFRNPPQSLFYYYYYSYYYYLFIYYFWVNSSNCPELLS